MLTKIYELYQKIILNVEFLKKLSNSNSNTLSVYNNTYLDCIKSEANANDVKVAYDKEYNSKIEKYMKNGKINIRYETNKPLYYEYARIYKKANAKQRNTNVAKFNIVKLALESYKIMISICK